MRKLFTFLLLAVSTTVTAQPQFCYEDKDGDTYGDPNTAVQRGEFGICPVIGGPWVNNGLDCNDTKAGIHPFATEVCNGVDDNCNGQIDEGVTTIEVCNGVDDNCNGQIDEGVKTTFYRDADGDHFGDPNNTTEACTAPAGYITDNRDCDDKDQYANPEGVWYPDPDNDGYLNYQDSVIRQCSRPAGYKHIVEGLVLTMSDDCNQNDPIEHPDQKWYKDTDGDKYPADLTDSVACSRPIGYSAKIELRALTPDCADDDSSLNPGTVWGIDLDNDGYCVGSPLTQCLAPSADHKKGIFLGGGDCNDNDPVEHPNQHWLHDNDHDRYPLLELSITQCTRPPGYFAVTELITVFDCNDNDSTIYTGAPELCDGKDNNCNGQIDDGGVTSNSFVLDADGDGYYPGSPIVQCTSPGQGYILLTQILNGGQLVSNKSPGDCDDTNRDINPASKWVVDADRDGYYPGSPIVQCLSPGQGYILLFQILNSGQLVFNKSPGDCDDNNILLHPATRWYKDTDDDRYSDGTTKTQCERPAGHKLASELTATTGDCNDDNADFNPATVWYKDADNDGFSDGTPGTQCERPTGYKLTSELTPFLFGSFGDCDDTNAAINPRTVWYQDLDNDGYSNGFSAMTCGRATGWKLASELTATAGDCNDNNKDINPATVWYKDADNDKYSDGTMQTQCAKPTGYKLLSELTATNGDCNDNDGLLNPTTVWYKDADADGYSNGATLTQCSRPANYKLTSELTRTSGDCNDSDPGISPAAVEVCGNKVDDNCNGAVDEGTCFSCKNATNLNATGITSTSAQVSWSAIANPVQWQLQYKTTRPGSKWVDVLLTGNLRTYKLSSLSSNQNYQVQIRAKCGNTWTSYAAAVGFKTLAGGGLLSLTNVEANPAIELNAEGSSTIMLHPNPTNGRFMLRLNVAGKINGKAQIQLIDITGKTVHSENAVMYNGALQKAITVSSTLAKGMYLVRIVVNNKTYKTPLVYEK